MLGCCFWHLFFVSTQSTFPYREKRKPSNAEMLQRRKHLHSGVLWSPLWESHRMNEAVHKEWCQLPCSTKSSRLLDYALQGRGKEMLQIPDWGTWDSQHLHQNKERFLEVSKLHQVLVTFQESRQALLRTEDNATTLHISSRGTGNSTQIALVWADTLFDYLAPTGNTSGYLHSKVKNNLFLGNQSCCFSTSKGTTILLLQLWYSNSWNIWGYWRVNKGYTRFLESFLHFPFRKVGLSIHPCILLSQFLRFCW